MSGRHGFDELTKDFTPERRARVDARKAGLRAAMPLHELRQARAMTQKAVGDGVMNDPAIWTGNGHAMSRSCAIDGGDFGCRQHVMLAPGRTVDKAQKNIGCQRERKTMVRFLKATRGSRTCSEHYLRSHQKR